MITSLDLLIPTPPGWERIWPEEVKANHFYFQRQDGLNCMFLIYEDRLVFSAFRVGGLKLGEDKAALVEFYGAEAITEDKVKWSHSNCWLFFDDVTPLSPFGSFSHAERRLWSTK